jgi:EAL domain-containing protein (putative c-di-GMP-specific phosphodiesterase class I)
VAEGIEDGVQLARLREAGCAYGQGFHFAPPLTATDLAAFLAEHDQAAAGSVLSRPPLPRPATS